MPAIPPAQAALMEAIAAQAIGRDKGLHMLPFFISGVLDSLLMGIVISQMVAYCRFIRTDRKHIVAIVLMYQVMGVAGTAAASIILLLWMQHLFIWSFGKFLTFTETLWLTRYVAINVGTTLLVQLFYIDRACRLVKHWWPALAILPFALGATGAQIAFIEVGYKRNDFISPDILAAPNIKAMTYSLLSLTLVADILITCIIIYGLYRVKTGWAHTDSTLRRLMIKSFEAQLPALVIALVSFIAWNQQFEVALPFVLIQTKIYVLGLLITLNLRSNPSDSQGGVNVSYPSESRGKQSQSTSYPLSSISESKNGVSSRGEAVSVTLGQAKAWELPHIGNAGGWDEEVVVIGPPSAGHGDQYGSSEHLSPQPLRRA